MLKIYDKIKHNNLYAIVIDNNNSIKIRYIDNNEDEVITNDFELVGSIAVKSKYMSKLLRHEPEDLVLDKDGYVLIVDILKKLDISLNELLIIVEFNDKKRFTIENDKIRAAQGHNSGLDISIKMKKVTDTNIVLYHGTSSENYKKIISSKYILPMDRQYVNLTDDIEVAKKTGLRKAKNKNNLIILKIDVAKLLKNNIELLLSDNNVYQVVKIPINCFSKIITN